VSIIFGVIQTAFYCDFAWVYYSRQRVKLRHGGLVDGEDLRNGWLLRRVLGNKTVDHSIDDDDEESAPALGDPNNPTRTGPLKSSKWGKRGISVSADDGIAEHERERGLGGQESGVIDRAQEGDEDAKMRDPDELARILEDDESDDDGLPSPAVAGVKNGSEWHD